MEDLDKGMSGFNELPCSCLATELFPVFGNSHFVNEGRVFLLP